MIFHFPNLTQVSPQYYFVLRSADWAIWYSTTQVSPPPEFVLHRSDTNPLRCRRQPSLLYCTEAIPMNSGVAATRVCSAQQLRVHTYQLGCRRHLSLHCKETIPIHSGVAAPPPEFIQHRSYIPINSGVAATRVCIVQKLYPSTRVSPPPEFVLHNDSYPILSCHFQPGSQWLGLLVCHVNLPF